MNKAFWVATVLVFLGIGLIVFSFPVGGWALGLGVGMYIALGIAGVAFHDNSEDRR